jgi:5,10-methylenetetrahydromethanopterin reductase
MRIGINAANLLALGAPLTKIYDHAARAEADGFTSYWLGQMAVPDALTTIAALGSRTTTIELGTAVVPTWTRHPLMLAGQALTVQEIVGNRLTLGIGLAHKALVEPTLKVNYVKTSQHMDEYLDVLIPTLRDRICDATGEIWSGADDLSGSVKTARAPSLLLAAMGPRMLALAGRRADGSILWLSGPRTIEGTIRPALDAAAHAAERPSPRIVAGLPICVTDDPARVRAQIDHALDKYGKFDSYRHVLDLEGVSGPGDVALVGDADAVREGLDALAKAGATDFAATEFATNGDEAAATRALLTTVAA